MSIDHPSPLLRLAAFAWLVAVLVLAAVVVAFDSISDRIRRVLGRQFVAGWFPAMAPKEKQHGTD
jgi:hypothetical protein